MAEPEVGCHRRTATLETDGPAPITADIDSPVAGDIDSSVAGSIDSPVAADIDSSVAACGKAAAVTADGKSSSTPGKGVARAEEKERDGEE
jgi:hypothetical protein